ncbi:MAG: HD-GYP domain-containing protein [Armatimonadota bacterium]
MRKGGRAGPIIAIIIVAITLGATTLLVYLDNGAESAGVQFYYIPILVAGFFLGDIGAILTALIAALLCGPHMKWNIETGEDQTLTQILLRMCFFYVIGIIGSRVAFELRRRAAEFKTLYEVARTINSTLRVQEVLDLIAKSALEVMDAKGCTIRLLEDGESLRLGASAGLSADYVRKGPVVLAESELDRRVLEGGPVAIRNVQEDSSWQYPEAAGREGLTSVLSVALRTSDGNKGVIRIYARRQRSFTPDEIALVSAFANQAAIAIENAELYEDIRRNYYETVRALTMAIEAKDPATLGHSERVTVMATALARELGCDAEQVEQIRFGTILHDIGKIGIDESMLEQGAVAEAEEIFLRMHPLIGKSILDPVEFLRPSLTIVLHHHEHWDGSGYPEGLKGQDIPFFARLVGVINAYDLLVSPQDGSAGISESAAEDRIAEEAGVKWDAEIVEVLRKMLRDRRGKLVAGHEEALPRA